MSTILWISNRPLPPRFALELKSALNKPTARIATYHFAPNWLTDNYAEDVCDQIAELAQEFGTNIIAGELPAHIVAMWMYAGYDNNRVLCIPVERSTSEMHWEIFFTPVLTGDNRSAFNSAHASNAIH